MASMDTDDDMPALHLKLTPTGVWRYRRTVPADLRGEVGQREWKHSLGRLTKTEAVLLAQQLDGANSARITSLRSSRPQAVPSTAPLLPISLSPQAIHGLAAGVYAECLKADDEGRAMLGGWPQSPFLLGIELGDDFVEQATEDALDRLTHDPDEDPETHTGEGVTVEDADVVQSMYTAAVAAVQDMLGYGRIDPVWSSVVAPRIRDMGISPDYSNTSHRAAALECLRAILRAAEVCLRRFEGVTVEAPTVVVSGPAVAIPAAVDHGQQHPPSSSAPAPRKASGKATGPCLSELVDHWQRAKNPRGKSADETRKACKDFEEAIRERHGGSLHVPAVSLTKADMVAFRGYLESTPSGRGGKRSAKTVGKAMALVCAVLRAAADDDVVLPDHSELGRIGSVRPTPPRAGERAGEDRLPFSPDDIRAIFKSKAFTEGYRSQAGRGEALYWIPLLLCATGARLGEVAQLHVSDVAMDERGLVSVSINPYGEGKAVKTDASRRTTPVHSALLRLGFMAYVQSVKAAGHQRLFPGVVNGEEGSPWGKAWTRYVRDVVGITGSRKAPAHSFRHSMADMLRDAGVPKDVHYAITGHAEAEAGARYGSGFSLRVLSEAIEKIPLGDLLGDVVPWEAPSEAPRRP